MSRAMNDGPGHMDPTDDPRLTAYALGELPDADRAEVEALLARSAAARAFVDETRAFAASLAAEMTGAIAAAPGGGLAESQRTVVRAAAAPSVVAAARAPSGGGRVFRVSPWPGRIGIAAAAAFVAVAFAGRHDVGRWWTGGEEWRDAERGALRGGAATAYPSPTGPYYYGTGGGAGGGHARPAAGSAARAAGRATTSGAGSYYHGGGGGGGGSGRLGDADGHGQPSWTQGTAGGLGGAGSSNDDLEPLGGGAGGGAGGNARYDRDGWKVTGASGGGGGGALLIESSGTVTVGESERARSRDALGGRGGGGAGGSVLLAGLPESRGNLPRAAGPEAGRRPGGAGHNGGGAGGGPPARTYGWSVYGGAGGAGYVRTADPGAGTNDFSAVTIQKGATLRLRASAPLTIRALNFNLDGTVALPGVAGSAPGAPGAPALGQGSGGAAGGGGGPQADPALGDTPIFGTLFTADGKRSIPVTFDDVFFGTAGANLEPSVRANAAVAFLKAENLYGAALTTGTFDVDIAQAAAIGDPAGRRAALAAIVESARRRADGSPESYRAVEDNPFRRSLDSPLSTFGIDVDTASYANVRRFLNGGTLPPPGAVRIEELVNYFPYRYDPPTDGGAFAVHAEVASCPWNPAHRLARIGIKGREVDLRERPPSNLVFLVDVSGSMEPANKLPLLVQSMKELVATLDARDKVAVVVYAGNAGMALPTTSGDRHDVICTALDNLRAGGSTNGGEGIELAYRTATENFVAGGINRVVLATDGDFNVGVSDESSLVQLITEKAKSKVFLSVLGFGEGNLQDAKMEALADKGNGNYAYVDSLKEGRKVLVEQGTGTLLTIAKDVKLQVEFNPERVAAYRLIGYENRVLATEDFADDRKDAGDLGAGHTVTALYELVPATDTAPATAQEPLRYVRPAAPTDAALSGELLCVKLRHKAPEGDASTLQEFTVTDSGRSFDAGSADFQFAAAVACFGMTLRGSPDRGSSSFDLALELATAGQAYDPDGSRAEFVGLVRKAKDVAAARR